MWFAGYIDLFTLSTHVLCLFSSGLFALMLSQFATRSFVNVYIIVDFNPLSPFQLNLSASLKCSVLPLSFVSWLSVWCLCFTKSVLFLNNTDFKQPLIIIFGSIIYTYQLLYIYSYGLRYIHKHFNEISQKKITLNLCHF